MLLICYLNTMDHCCFYCAKPCQEICNDCQIYAFCSPEHKEYHQVNNTCLPFKVLHYIHNKCLNCLLHFFSKYYNCHKIWQFIFKIEVDSIDFENYKVNLQDTNSVNWFNNYLVLFKDGLGLSTCFNHPSFITCL